MPKGNIRLPHVHLYAEVRRLAPEQLHPDNLSLRIQEHRSRHIDELSSRRDKHVPAIAAVIYFRKTWSDGPSLDRDKLALGIRAVPADIIQPAAYCAARYGTMVFRNRGRLCYEGC